MSIRKKCSKKVTHYNLTNEDVEIGGRERAIFYAKGPTLKTFNKRSVKLWEKLVHCGIAEKGRGEVI